MTKKITPTEWLTIVGLVALGVLFWILGVAHQ